MISPGWMRVESALLALVAVPKDGDENKGDLSDLLSKRLSNRVLRVHDVSSEILRPAGCNVSSEDHAEGFLDTQKVASDMLGQPAWLLQFQKTMDTNMESMNTIHDADGDGVPEEHDADQHADGDEVLEKHHQGGFSERKHP
jgi:hypothetical protein